MLAAMAPVFLTLPVPAGLGPGAKIDVTGTAATKVVFRKFNIAAGVEAACDVAGTQWVPLDVELGGETTIQIATRWMRARNLKDVPVTSTIGLAALPATVTMASLDVPAGDGLGSVLDISTWLPFRTVQVSGQFTGTLIYLTSVDGVSYARALTFTQPGIASRITRARYVRIRRVGTTGGPTPTVIVGSSIIGIEEDQVSEGGGGSEPIPPTTGINGELDDLTPGTPVASVLGVLRRGDATSYARSQLVGVVSTLTASTLPTPIITEGPLTLTTGEWDDRTGQSGGLTPSAKYWLSILTGKLSTAAPIALTQFVVPIGHALTSTTLLVALGPMIQL